jgi:hypothetical protein
MKRSLFRVVHAGVLGGGILALAVIAPPVFAQDDEFDGLPPGEGQEITFYACSACHSIKLVTQQRLSRDRWDDTLVYMVEEQAMEPLDPEDRKTILDYLGQHLGQDVPR